jgi:hypothetical protein
MPMPMAQGQGQGTAMINVGELGGKGRGSTDKNR